MRRLGLEAASIRSPYRDKGHNSSARSSRDADRANGAFLTRALEVRALTPAPIELGTDWLFSTASSLSVILVWKAIQWPAAIFFVALSCSLIYRYGPRLERAPSLALVDAWRGIWRVYMAGGLVWISYAPAIF